MVTVICDPVLEQSVRDRRADSEDNRFDEVWDGVYYMNPMAGDEHQELVSRFLFVLQDIPEWSQAAKVRPGVNISDRIDDWRSNYRCPDVVAFLPENPAQNHGAFWLGGPDLAIEIVSEGDRAKEKIPFYGAVGVRELLILDRQPWSLEHYIAKEGQLSLIGTIVPNDGKMLGLTTAPLRLQLTTGKPRPVITAKHTSVQKKWTI